MDIKEEFIEKVAKHYLSMLQSSGFNDLEIGWCKSEAAKLWKMFNDLGFDIVRKQEKIM